MVIIAKPFNTARRMDGRTNKPVAEPAEMNENINKLKFL